MHPPEFSGDGHQAPLAPVDWRARSGMIADRDPALASALRDEIRRHWSGDLQSATTADEALDLIGAASRPLDLVFLGTATAAITDSAHIISQLRRQGPPTVVLAYGIGAPPLFLGFPAFAGIADWLDLSRSRTWPRKVQQAIDSAATIAAVLGRVRVPWHIDTDVARHVYNADPGETFTRPRD